MVGALFCPIWQIFPVWFHCTMSRRLCCFRLTIVLENCYSDTRHNISRHKLATVFLNSMCEISFMTRFNQQRCQCFTVWWEFGFWTACNHFKRYCTLPYCKRATRKVMHPDLIAWHIRLWKRQIMSIYITNILCHDPSNIMQIRTCRNSV